MLLRSLPRVGQQTSSSSAYLCAPRRTANVTRPFHATARSAAAVFESSQQRQYAAPPSSTHNQSRAAHAIANPTLAGIEKRWEAMPPQDQAALWMQLRDRMKVDWHEMTIQEKKAAWWIAFGPHGPRAETPPGEWGRVFLYTGIAVAVSIVIFMIGHSFSRPPPRTMTKEWQEATNEYLKKERSNPIYGISSEGYSGKGYVQSKAERKA
ncbi:hypothetical protein GJ744_009626 [Endocarpon pusillum]|uniref:Cytochrome c oxidase polypeptide V n=1 Tax=Endocarpon pusillum TaxID=364733 RepID=A0A8H7E2F1_9EURO|nr:hypothetical protein GJ744_009626 [Endocarpon pusillum]